MSQEIKLNSVEHAFYQAGLQQGIWNQLQQTLTELQQLKTKEASALSDRIKTVLPQMQLSVTASLDSALAMRPQHRRTLSDRIKRAVMVGVRSFQEG